MLGHQVNQEEGYVQPEDAVVGPSRVPQPGRDVLNRAAARHQRGQCQRGRITRIAEAEIIHVDDAGDVAVGGHNDVLRRGVMQKRCRRDAVDFLAHGVQRALHDIDRATVEQIGRSDAERCTAPAISGRADGLPMRTTTAGRSANATSNT